MVKLSVNINKIATLRNARGGNTPNLLSMASDIQSYGADGITIHPRPDQRHITYEDANELPNVIYKEFNIEGNPIDKFVKLVCKIKPTQVTLVPDAIDAITSNSGWDTIKNKSFLKDVISEDVKYHIQNNIPLLENIYRPGSDKHINLIKETRLLWERKMITLSKLDTKLFEATDLGLFDYYDGELVALDLPFTDDTINEAKYKGKEVELNKPKRGGSKKFYVYVRKPGGGVKKVSFGDTTGLSVKINDPKARKSFAKRHDCANKKDKTMAGYWACRLPRYASLLGLKSKFGGFW